MVCGLSSVKLFSNLILLSYLSDTESIYLSAFLNASEISFPFAQIQQNYMKRHNNISVILCGVFKIPETTFVGSIAEGLNVLGSGIDVILFADNLSTFGIFDFRPLPEVGYPGYSKLLVSRIDDRLIEYTHLKDGKRYLKNNLKDFVIYSAANDRFPYDLRIHGSAYTAALDESLIQNMEVKDLLTSEVDIVLCIKSKKWPPQASEWKTRRRASNWPTTKLVEQIIHAGYNLAAVGSKESIESGVQWRVSFNKAEQLIIES